ncbi:MAG: hypothetical protein JNK53_08265, partial [Phycisphaerae bacterium]|nr:hypothetical protein [Phycisphaerae bacterium]
MYENVRVVSQEQDRSITLEGQEMRVLFTMESGVGDGLVVQRDVHQPVSAPPGKAAVQAALLAIAHAPLAPFAPGDEAIIITYSGRLILVPAESDVPPLATEKAVRIEMFGAPARIEDSKSKAVLTGKAVWFESEVEVVRLTGDAATPATLESPDFGLRAIALHMNRTTGIGTIEGAGNLRLGAVEKKPIRVQWSRSARFGLAPGSTDSEGSFRNATFEGDVQVRSKDFSLDSGTLLVEAEPVGKRDVLRRLVATDNVRATDLGAREGRLAAQRIEMALAPDETGNAVPRTMHATGGVMVSDTQQTIWSESLRTAFVAPKALAPGAPGASSASSASGAGAFGDGTVRADVGSVIADGPVELLLKDGTRVWASRMEGDAIRGTARLSGPNVLVVRGNSVIDQLADLQVQEKPGKLSVAGPGRVSYYSARALPEGRARLGRPTLLQVPVMQATWREGLAYADRAIPGKLGAPDRGLLLLQGAVKMRASRSPLEAEAMDADEVQIELVPQSGNAPRTASAAADDMGSLARVIARGNVRIETQEWRDASRAGEPRLFRLLSSNATYDVAAGLCSVDGAGTILVHDPPIVDGVTVEKASSAFASEGTTKFTWQRSLGMKSADEG